MMGLVNRVGEILQLNNNEVCPTSNDQANVRNKTYVLGLSILSFGKQLRIIYIQTLLPYVLRLERYQRESKPRSILLPHCKQNVVTILSDEMRFPGKGNSCGTLTAKNRTFTGVHELRCTPQWAVNQDLRLKLEFKITHIRSIWADKKWALNLNRQPSCNRTSSPNVITLQQIRGFRLVRKDGLTMIENYNANWGYCQGSNKSKGLDERDRGIPLTLGILWYSEIQQASTYSVGHCDRA